MSKQIIEDAQAAYNAWRESVQGSYVERVLADGIVRDIVPALIHAAQRKPMPIGYGSDVELSADAGIAEPDNTDDDD